MNYLHERVTLRDTEKESKPVGILHSNSRQRFVYNYCRTVSYLLGNF